jgi:hypothetical protein
MSSDAPGRIEHRFSIMSLRANNGKTLLRVEIICQVICISPSALVRLEKHFLQLQTIAADRRMIYHKPAKLF